MNQKRHFPHGTQYEEINLDDIVGVFDEFEKRFREFLRTTPYIEQIL